MLADIAGRGSFAAPGLTLNPSLLQQQIFSAPAVAGRRITAGFSYIQRIGKSANIDVWFPQELRRRLDALLDTGVTLGAGDFPAEWAAIRQFELLQEGGNYKIYDLDATHITRSMVHLARDMRAGGYRVTIATLGGYAADHADDDLHILDQRLQERLSQLVRMLYLEEESTRRNAGTRQLLEKGLWDYREAVPHIGATLGARDIFRPVAQDASLKPAERRHLLARQFFDALSLLPANHIAHDTAIGLQLPELIGENEWIYVSPEDETLGRFNQLLGEIFAPFDKMSLGGLHGRADAGREEKATVNHLRGTGDRLNFSAEAFYRSLAAYVP